MNTNRTSVIFLTIVGGIGFAVGIASMLFFNADAGDLEPTAPPGPTMKTLDEVEPRMPIPYGGYTINDPGSYYLTGDLSSPIFGILVECDNVTIDLMGYTLSYEGAEGAYGIYMDGRNNVEIRNGTVRDFGAVGIYEKDMTSSGHRIIGVRVVSNGSTGILLTGRGNLIKDCTAFDNQNNGISVSYGSTVTGNTCCYNQGIGIRVVGGCTITGNTVYRNEESGIRALGASTIDGNTLDTNNGSKTQNGAGISVDNDCMVKGNTLDGNYINNIFVGLSNNSIEENLVTDSTGYGIYFNDTGNFYANNRASDNSTADYGGSVPTGSGDGGGNASF